MGATNYTTNSDMLTLLALRVKEYRLAARMSQKELAEQSGVSQTTEPASICSRMTFVPSKLASRRYVLRFWVTLTRESPARETNRWCKPKSLLPDVILILVKMA